MEIEFSFYTDVVGNITVSVVPDNGETVMVPSGASPLERDALINAFMEEQRSHKAVTSFPSPVNE